MMQVRASRISGESALAQIIRLVERALASRAPIERTVDRVARVFVPLVVLLALADFALLVATHASVANAMMRATTILVIACPCALGLATPLAITTAVGSASKDGLLISESSMLETMGKIDVVVLDKTGTMTRGDFKLVEFAAVETRAEAFARAQCGAGLFLLQSPQDRQKQFVTELLPMLAGIEIWSEHLLGRALVQYAIKQGVQPLDAKEIEIHKGLGISGFVAGRPIYIGNRQLMTDVAAEVDDGAEEPSLQWQHAGRTVAFFAWDGVVRGVLAFSDEIKPGAAEMVESLRVLGMAVKMVSGDARATTWSVARRIGFGDSIAEATPAAKARIVADLQKAGKRVALIGDGVNDASALAQADLGIALGTGADIAMGAAPVVLVSGVLSKVEEVFNLGARTTRVVRQNLFWAFFYNIAGISLALSGVLTPIFAAAAMLLSSTSVVANSMRLTRQEGK
jgi:heavy metal translocating P-type ATPase